MKLSIQLVVWNGSKYLPALFDSLAKQSFQDFELLIWDNGSNDDSLKICKGEIQRFGGRLRIFERNENIGFAPAHASLFLQSNTPYALVLNQDIVFNDNVIELAIKFLDNHNEAASVSPMLFRLEDGKPTNIIDSLGLSVSKSRKVSDIKQGEDWNLYKDKFTDKPISVFGVSGAAAFYRRQAVIFATEGELFDCSYFAYQEDFDLAWRLRLFGGASFVLPGAIGYHYRGTREKSKKGLIGLIENKKKQPLFIRKCSYRNHLLTLLKNDDGRNFMVDLPFILWYEVGKLVYLMFFDFSVLAVFKEIWLKKSVIKKEREYIRINRKTSPAQIREWFLNI